VRRCLITCDAPTLCATRYVHVLRERRSQMTRSFAKARDGFPESDPPLVGIALVGLSQPIEGSRTRRSRARRGVPGRAQAKETPREGSCYLGSIDSGLSYTSSEAIAGRAALRAAFVSTRTASSRRRCFARQACLAMTRWADLTSLRMVRTTSSEQERIVLLHEASAIEKVGGEWRIQHVAAGAQLRRVHRLQHAMAPPDLQTRREARASSDPGQSGRCPET
jgi:hypothetical protein